MFRLIKKSLLGLMLIISILTIFSVDSFATEAPIYGEEIPEIYKPYIYEVRKDHPNWKFEFLHTGLDWYDVVAHEDVFTATSARSLISGTSTPKAYWSIEPGAYDSETDTYIPMDATSWYKASTDVVEYYMDPRNFLSEADIFQFEKLSYDDSIHSINGVKTILRGSFMESNYISAEASDITYAEAFMNAAKQSGVSPYHLASKSIQELGKNGSGSVSGKYPGYEGIYNYYNIGASAGDTPIVNGLSWASSTQQAAYMCPWDTPYKSILGGAVFIGQNYITKGQNTLYLEKFDLDDSYFGKYSHQYMQNISGAFDESRNVYQAYKESNILNESLVFVIPVYENMPEERQKLPGDDTFFECELHPENFKDNIVEKIEVIDSPCNIIDESNIHEDIQASSVIFPANPHGYRMAMLEYEKSLISEEKHKDISLNELKNEILSQENTEKVPGDNRKIHLFKLIKEQNNVMCLEKIPTIKKGYIVNEKNLFIMQIPNTVIEKQQKNKKGNKILENDFLYKDTLLAWYL